MVCDYIKKHPNQLIDAETERSMPSMQCDCVDRDLFAIKGLRTHITPYAIWEKFVPMGFEQFKIEGRTSPRLNLIETYLYYMVKPECRDEARYLFLYNLEKHGVVRIDR